MTLTRNDSNDVHVKVQLHYALGDKSTFTSGVYRAPMAQQSKVFTLEPGEKLSFSTPIGGPIYLSIYGEEHLPVTVTAENVVLHPTIDDFTDENQINTFIDTFLNTETPHVDLKMYGAEFHMRKDRFLDTGAKVDDIHAILKKAREGHVNTIHKTASLTVEGKSLAETQSKEMMAVCAMLGETDCLDEELHTRKGTQHANLTNMPTVGWLCR